MSGNGSLLFGKDAVKTRKLLVVGFLALVTWGACSAQMLHWPTDASKLLSSSFCEYRPGRFHAGIDIKTNGAVGYKVFAVRPGYVSRVVVSPYGYGRVLYQVLDTGETAVYAHLSRFMEGIEERIYAEQERRGRFSVELYFRPTEFPVEQGQTIAYTGQSGTSAPHLHFELRDRYNCPLNPLLFGLPVQDTRAPVLRRLALIPMDVASRVDNDLRPALRALRALPGSRFSLPEVPEVWGRIGLAVSCFDQADGASNRFSVYSLRLMVDGREAFRSEYQRFCYEQNREMVLDREFRLEARGYGDFQRLFRDPSNGLRFYRSPFPSAGVLLCGVEGAPGDLLLNVGQHEIVIEARDYAGNKASLEFSLLVVSPGRQQPLTSPSIAWSKLLEEADSLAEQIPGPWPEDTSESTVLFLAQGDSMRKRDEVVFFGARRGAPVRGGLIVESDFYDDFARVVVRTPQRLLQPPRLAVWYSGEKTLDLVSWAIGPQVYVTGLPIQGRHRGELCVEAEAVATTGDTLWGASCATLWPVSPERGGRVRSEDGLCEIRFEGGAVYRPLYARVEEVTILPASRVPVIGKVYRFEPSDVPLKGRGWLSISLAEQQSRPEQLAIYGVGQKGVLSFMGSQVEPRGTKVWCSIGRLGTFAVVRDSVPPVITALLPADGATLATRQPMLRVDFYDRLSGIGGEESIELRLDGERVIAEYDPPRRCAFYQPRKPLTVGPHRVSVVVTDRCGNSARAEHRFIVR